MCQSCSVKSAFIFIINTGLGGVWFIRMSEIDNPVGLQVSNLQSRPIVFDFKSDRRAQAQQIFFDGGFASCRSSPSGLRKFLWWFFRRAFLLFRYHLVCVSFRIRTEQAKANWHHLPPKHFCISSLSLIYCFLTYRIGPSSTLSQ